MDSRTRFRSSRWFLPVSAFSLTVDAYMSDSRDTERSQTPATLRRLGTLNCRSSGTVPWPWGTGNKPCYQLGKNLNVQAASWGETSIPSLYSKDWGYLLDLSVSVRWVLRWLFLLLHCRSWQVDTLMLGGGGWQQRADRRNTGRFIRYEAAGE